MVDQIPAQTYTPQNLIGWWGGEDRRIRCVQDNKVVLSEDAAKAKAARIVARGDVTMNAYEGRCGHWHLGHRRVK